MIEIKNVDVYGWQAAIRGMRNSWNSWNDSDSYFRVCAMPVKTSYTEIEQIIQLLPSSYNQRRTVQLNYEVPLKNYRARKNHKLDEWRTFCSWIETLPYMPEFLGGE